MIYDSAAVPQGIHLLATYSYRFTIQLRFAMIRNAFLIVIFMALMFYQSACKSKPDAFEELSCKPPCWQGLTPGETTKSELIELSDTNSPLIEKETIVEGSGYRIFQSDTSFNLKSGIAWGSLFFG